MDILLLLCILVLWRVVPSASLSALPTASICDECKHLSSELNASSSNITNTTTRCYCISQNQFWNTSRAHNNNPFYSEIRENDPGRYMQLIQPLPSCDFDLISLDSDADPLCSWANIYDKPSSQWFLNTGSTPTR